MSFVLHKLQSALITQTPVLFRNKEFCSVVNVTDEVRHTSVPSENEEFFLAFSFNR